LIETREAADDFCVLTARGSDLEQAFPFGIVRQLLEPLLAAADQEQRDALLAGAGALAGGCCRRSRPTPRSSRR